MIQGVFRGEVGLLCLLSRLSDFTQPTDTPVSVSLLQLITHVCVFVCRHHHPTCVCVCVCLRADTPPPPMCVRVPACPPAQDVEGLPTGAGGSHSSIRDVKRAKKGGDVSWLMNTTYLTR